MSKSKIIEINGVKYYYSNGYWCFYCSCSKGLQFSGSQENYCSRCGKKLHWDKYNKEENNE